MEGDLLGYPSNVKEQGSGKPDYSLGVDRVVCISCLDRGFQALGREPVFPDKSPVEQEILAPLSMRAQVSMAFIICEGVMS